MHSWFQILQVKLQLFVGFRELQVVDKSFADLKSLELADLFEFILCKRFNIDLKLLLLLFISLVELLLKVECTWLPLQRLLLPAPVLALVIVHIRCNLTCKQFHWINMLPLIRGTKISSWFFLLKSLLISFAERLTADWLAEGGLANKGALVCRTASRDCRTA